jgi:hypothetical protein
MKSKRLLFVALFLLANYSVVFSQTQAPQGSTKTLRNGDVLRMHKAGVKPDAIISKIVTSPCNFDTFPPVLRELRMKGLPGIVIGAMIMVPYGPPDSSPDPIPEAAAALRTAKVEIPAGTVVEVETTSKVSSANIEKGGRINLRVSRRVFVNGVLVINRGASARGRVIKHNRAKAWGRGGTLDWILEDVVAVDGTVVPIKLTNHVKGNDRSAAVVAAAIVTGAIVFPYTPPVGLIWALKKGGEAFLDESKKSMAIVGSDTEVVGMVPDQKKVIYHSVQQLNATNPTKARKGASSPKAPRSSGSNNKFRATPLRKH